jgi:ankyrin repeat protein
MADDTPALENLLDDVDSDDDDMPALNGCQGAIQALLGASLDGNLNRVRELLGGVGVNSSDSQGYTALFAASQGGHVALVNMLTKAGAKVDQAVEDGATSLYIASQEGKLEVVKALIKAKAKVDQATENGCTSLFIASQNGKLEVVKALIKAKAKVDQATEDGRTPIYIASEQGHLEVIEALIEAKAKVNQADEDGVTPIYAASQDDHPLVVQVLIDAGARSAELMFDGYAPLHIAAQEGNLSCVKVLTGFRPDTPAWATFLAGATSKKELEASLAPPGERPPSYLPKIFDRAYLEPIWKFQQERYSDLHLKDDDGHTALDMAVADKKTDVAKLLRSMMVQN